MTCSLNATAMRDGLVKKNGFSGIRKVKANSQRRIKLNTDVKPTTAL
jgi:hypothetical protein